MSLFKRIDTVFLPVTNLEKSIKWYCEVLGFSVRWQDIENGYAALNVGETPLTLVQSEKMNNQEQTPFNFFASDINLAFAHLKEQSVKVDQIESDDTVQWFDFYDPDNNKLGVCYFKE